MWEAPVRGSVKISPFPFFSHASCDRAFISSLKLIKKPSLSVLTARQRALIHIRFPPSILIESGYKGLSQASRLPLAVICKQYTIVRGEDKWKGLLRGAYNCLVYSKEKGELYN